MMTEEYFQRQIRICREQENRRIAEDRKDEANLEKIRANIFRIFLIVYQRSLKEAQPESFFRGKLRQISQNWRRAYDKACLQENAEGILIEQTKLETAEEILAFLEKEAFA